MGFCMLCAYVGSDLRAGVARSVGVVGRKVAVRATSRG